MIEENNKKRGPGVWKFNNTLLSDEKFTEQMRTEIVNSINNTTHSNMSAIDKWEYLKIRCKANAQLYSRQKAREKTDLINNLHRL